MPEPAAVDQPGTGVGAAVHRRHAALLAVLGCLSGVFTVTGTVHAVLVSFNRMPMADSWEGQLGFWMRAKSGMRSVWWVPHSEHRIILSRLLFWIDGSVFDAQQWFLVTWDVILLVLLGSTVVWSLRLLLREDRLVLPRPLSLAIIGALVTMLASWMQRENLVWGFQVQFVMAILVPLVTLVLVGRSADPSRTERSRRLAFALSLLGSALSFGTMASGVSAAWMTALLALLLFGRSRRTLAHLAVTVTGSFAYLYDFHPRTGRDPLGMVFHHPLRVAKFVLMYLGGPVRVASGTHWFAVVAGTGLLGLVGVHTVRTWPVRHVHPIRSALLAFEGWIILSAMVVAAGRANFGIEQAAASRYQTPVLAAWAVVLVLHASAVVRMLRVTPVSASLVILAAPILLFATQTAAFGSRWADGANFIKNRAAIALALRIDDQVTLEPISNHQDPIFETAQLAIRAGLTHLAHDPYRSMRSSIGSIASRPLRVVTCRGGIDHAEAVPGTAWQRINGWAVDLRHPDTRSASAALVDRHGRIVGRVAWGGPRPDVAAAHGGRWGLTGFEGYVRVGTIGPLRIQTSRRSCADPLVATPHTPEAAP